MPKEHATGYDQPRYVSGLPKTYPRHHLDAAQSEYHAAKGPVIGLAEYFKKNPSHKSWVKGDIERFDKAQENLIKALAKHEGKPVRAVQLEFKEAANKAHSAASKIQKTYKKHKTGTGGRRRGTRRRYTRRR
jgi:hypothetical protein